MPQPPDATALEALGWRPFFASQLTPKDTARGQPARVVEAFRKRFLVHTGTSVEWVMGRGSMFYKAKGDKTSLPTVGDWVVVEEVGSPQGKIQRRLERQTLLVRHAAGERVQGQTIAANLDTLFVVTSLNQEFSPRRLERYISLAKESGITPVVLLNKADLVADPQLVVAKVQALEPGVLVQATSMVDGLGVGWVRELVSAGQTIALVGSSGVGKSTLINTLHGSGVQATAEIRQSDDRGRHTTTSRQLIVLPQGGILIDTPGMRELQSWQEERGTDTHALESLGFEDIETLGRQCQFRDCLHLHEKGCAVKAAVGRGEMDGGRLGNWIKLQRERRPRRSGKKS